MTDTKRKYSGRIAVVGMALHYAGSPNKDEFWDTLNANQTKTGPMSEKRMGARKKALHFVNSRPKYADTFNNDRYGTIDGPQVREGLDNEHDLLLKLAKEALRDVRRNRTGENAEVGGKQERVGIVSGCLSFPSDRLQGELLNLYQEHVERELPKLAQAPLFDAGVPGPWTTTKHPERDVDPTDKRFYMDPASFVAEELKLGGVRYSVDAACASALYVLKLASDHLLKEDSDVDAMLCGGVCFPEPLFILTGFSCFHAMPLKDGISMPLRKNTEGLTPGEGGSILVLKRYEDAVAAGDEIYGSLLGCRLNNSGMGQPLAPNKESQTACLAECYQTIGINPHMVQYVECHATGTPLGDVSECNAMYRVFEGRVPRFGSTKGNFGHTLVAAGFAGAAKVLLAMNKSMIPPTPGVNADTAVDDRVVRTQAEPWPDVSDGRLKRAGLSAFGFGGTNAHAVFEEAAGGLTAPPLPAVPKKGSGKMALVGLASHFGALKSTDDFERCIYEGGDASCELPAKRWRFFSQDPVFANLIGSQNGKAPRGCYVGDVDVDYKRIKTTLLLEDQLLPQQLLALQVMEDALLDSKLEKGGRVAVLVGLGTDLELYRHRCRVALKERLSPEILKEKSAEDKLMDYIHDKGTSTSYTSYIGNLVATRISSHWRFTGPAFTVTEGANSVFRCIQLGQMMLASGDIDAVVVAGVDMSAGAEAVYVKTRRFPLNPKHDRPTAAFEDSSWGYYPGEGCGAFVLKRSEDVVQNVQRVYCQVDGIANALGSFEAANKCFKVAGVRPDQVDYVELSADSKNGAAAELNDVGAAYSASSINYRAHCVSTVKANVGHCGYASGAAAVIKTALCLYNRYLPATPRWEKPANEKLWSENAKTFYVAPDSRAWSKNQGEHRHAGISGSCEVGSAFHVLLSDVDHETQNRVALPMDTPKLLVIRGASPETIAARLENELIPKIRAAAQFDLENLYRELLRETLEQDNNQASNFALSLVTTKVKLLAEAEAALQGVRRSIQTKVAWISPSGSCFTANPLRSDKVAFMYGDGAAPYGGLGRDVWRVFPSLYDACDDLTNKMWAVPDDAWNPRCVTAEEHSRLRKEFAINQVEMFRSGVFFSTLFTWAARNVLNIQPKAAFGLSLGEISMLFAFSKANSKRSDVLTERLMTSDVWTKEIAGKMNTLRCKWGVSPTAETKDFWQGCIVRGTRDQVLKAITDSGVQHVRALIVNDDKTVLIAGFPAECDRVGEFIGSNSILVRVPQGMVGHCPEVLGCVDGIEYIHEYVRLPDVSQIKLFSSHSLAPLTGNQGDDCRKFVSTVYASLADFPSTTNAVYRAGYDVFVELGPNSHRSSSVSSILTGKPHVSVAFDKQSLSCYTQVLRMSATLATHRVPGSPSLKALYPPSIYTPLEPPHLLLKNVVVNGRFLGVDENAITKDLRSRLLAQSTGSNPSVLKSLVERNQFYERRQAMAKFTAPLSTYVPAPKKIFVASPVVETTVSIPYFPTLTNGASVAKSPVSTSELKSRLLNLNQSVYLCDQGQSFVDGPGHGVSEVFPCMPASLGDPSFMKTYGVEFPMYTGAMAKGIASADLVIANGKRKILSSLGAGGLPLHIVAKNLEKIQAELPNGPFMVNLIHSPFNENLEKGCVDLLLERGVTFVEASAFMNVTIHVVRYRVKGLSRGDGPNGVVIKNRLIAKISRTELAEMFVRPAPGNLVNKLLESGDITAEQAELAKIVPLCDDIAVEADSGGHTDNRPMVVILPMIIAVRDRVHRLMGYPRELRVRVGAGGGIGDPKAVLAAFQMGAAFVVTGTINQMAKQSGSSDIVRGQLSKATYSDITMAPAADMFDQGVQLQVLKKGTMFAARAKKLYELFVRYNSLDEIPKAEREKLEAQVFRKEISVIWKETADYYRDVLKDQSKIDQAERDPKLKMSLVFRWYLGLSSTWANTGVADRATDYQVWCGPAIGSFNDYIRGSYLDPVVANAFPDVAQINMQLFRGACYLKRVAAIRTNPNLRDNIDCAADELGYRPDNAM